MFERLKKYDKKAIGQFIRFGIVGIINTLITLIVIYFLQEILHVKYTISNFIGYIAGVVNSNFIREAILFLVCFGICYGIQFISLLILVEILYVPDSWAQLLSMIVYTLCNFIMNRCITFKK